jgi:hypothetical protein
MATTDVAADWLAAFTAASPTAISTLARCRFVSEFPESLRVTLGRTQEHCLWLGVAEPFPSRPKNGQRRRIRATVLGCR